MKKRPKNTDNPLDHIRIPQIFLDTARRYHFYTLGVLTKKHLPAWEIFNPHDKSGSPVAIYFPTSKNVLLTQSRTLQPAHDFEQLFQTLHRLRNDRRS